MTLRHLSTRDLAERWTISRRTLDRWRWAGEGPRFLKLGGHVVYLPLEQPPAQPAAATPHARAAAPARSAAPQPASRPAGVAPWRRAG